MFSDNYLSQISLLYIEDDNETREEMETFLKRRVGKVILAKNGIDGIEKFEENTPDIVITDILMPELDGITMMRQIRNKGYNTPFIITSTKNESNTIIEVVDLGIIKYIIKPIKLRDLEECLFILAKEHCQNNFDFKSLNFDEKKQLEFEIKKEFSIFLKGAAGKGPRDISTFIHENQIDVVAYDTVTPMEQITLRNKESKTFVEKNRHIFYEEVSLELEEIISSILTHPVKLQNIIINLPKNDKLIFELFSSTKKSRYSL